jgi:hypothetical protein
MAGWGLDKEQLGGSRLLPAYPTRPTLRARLAEGLRILMYRPRPLEQLPEPMPLGETVAPGRRLAQLG